MKLSNPLNIKFYGQLLEKQFPWEQMVLGLLGPMSEGSGYYSKLPSLLSTTDHYRWQ
jgi:hypothetical protein